MARCHVACMWCTPRGQKIAYYGLFTCRSQPKTTTFIGIALKLLSAASMVHSRLIHLSIEYISEFCVIALALIDSEYKSSAIDSCTIVCRWEDRHKRARGQVLSWDTLRTGQFAWQRNCTPSSKVDPARRVDVPSTGLTVQVVLSDVYLMRFFTRHGYPMHHMWGKLYVSVGRIPMHVFPKKHSPYTAQVDMEVLFGLVTPATQNPPTPFSIL